LAMEPVFAAVLPMAKWRLVSHQADLPHLAVEKGA